MNTSHAIEMTTSSLGPVTTAPVLVHWSAWKRSWLWVGPAMLLIVGAIDLGLTITAFEAGELTELNPFAAAVLNHGGSSALAVYRFVMTISGCILLRWGLHAYRLRRFARTDYRRVRALLWTSQVALIASHLGLMAWWAAWLSL
jgi:hypothetical protein